MKLSLRLNPEDSMFFRSLAAYLHDSPDHRTSDFLDRISVIRFALKQACESLHVPLVLNPNPRSLSEARLGRPNNQIFS